MKIIIELNDDQFQRLISALKISVEDFNMMAVGKCDSAYALRIMDARCALGLSNCDYNCCFNFKHEKTTQ